MSLLPALLLALHAALWITAAVLAWRHLRGDDTRRELVALAVVSVAGLAVSFAMRLDAVAASRPDESSELAFVAGLAIAMIWLRRRRLEAGGAEASENDEGRTRSGGD